MLDGDDVRVCNFKPAVRDCEVPVYVCEVNLEERKGKKKIYIYIFFFHRVVVVGLHLARHHTLSAGSFFELNSFSLFVEYLNNTDRKTDSNAGKKGHSKSILEKEEKEKKKEKKLERN